MKKPVWANLIVLLIGINSISTFVASAEDDSSETEIDFMILLNLTKIRNCLK